MLALLPNNVTKKAIIKHKLVRQAWLIVTKDVFLEICFDVESLRLSEARAFECFTQLPQKWTMQYCLLYTFVKILIFSVSILS